MGSIKDVAKLAGVSVSTVSHVLNQTRFVSPETAGKVKKAIETLQFKPSAMARNLKVSRTKTVGVIIPDLYGAFFPDVISSIESALSSYGYRFFICHTGGNPANESEFIEQLASYKVDGLIIAVSGPEQNINLLKWVENQGIPVVYVDRMAPEGIHAPHVISDNFKAAKEAVIHLFQSYPQVAVISPYPEADPIKHRIEGYKAACLETGQDPILGLHEGWGESLGYKQTEEILKNAIGPIGLFCTTNSVTRGSYRYLQEISTDIPQEAGIVGFDDASWTTLVKPAISVVRSEPKRMGVIAAAKLLKMLGLDIPDTEEELIEASLIVRGSSVRNKD